MRDTERDAILRWKEGGPGARAAFRSIFDRRFDDVHRFLARVLGDAHAAEDAAQETFVRLHRGLEAFDPARPLWPFLLAIARNVSIDALRKRKRREKPLDEAEDAPAPFLDAASASERRAVVEEALRALAPEHRTVLLLRHVEGLKLEEIAEGASCTVRTVRNRLRAAGTLLGRELERRGIVPGEVEP